MGFPTRIFLTGFMASGKSTVGPLLADALGYRFVDMDHVIAERCGKSIPQIFEQEGERAFREAEREVLVELSGCDDIIIATGGGALASERGMRMARSSGVVVYLDASVETILERVGSNAAERPLLKGSVDEEVRRLLELRRPCYERSDLRVHVDGRAPAAIADEIRRRLND